MSGADTADSLKIKLTTKLTLRDTEILIGKISNSHAASIELWFAKELGAHLFKDTAIVGLLACARSLGKHIRVVDWFASPSDDHLAQLFGATIEGLACLEFANEIVDSQKRDLRPRIDHFRFQVIETNGHRMTESGKSFAFCAFDPDQPTPISFVGVEGKESFIRALLAIRKDFFEIGIGERFSSTVSRSADYSAAAFIYELWQNGIQHGRYDAKHQQISGMRYLRLKKHVGGNFERSLFLDRANGFPELRRYLDRVTRSAKHYKLYEVAVADSGIGIVNRFVATRPEYRSLIASSSDHPNLINRIIRESLSSKLNQTGAGHGLEQVLRAVGTLSGFLSVRTGNTWLYYDAFDVSSEVDDLALRVVTCDGLASVGTQISLIYPLMESGE